MAQVSYGTITITDTNDIEEIYTIYAGSSGDTQQDMPTWTYAAVTGGTIWKRDVSLVTGDYIWQSIVITKSGVVINATNWENFYNTPICITGPEGQGGQPGTPGKGISNITIQYCNYGSGEPANTGSHWQDTIPTYNSSKPNYWTKTTITYTVGDPFIKKVLDQGITDAMYNSAMANSISQSANENANGAMSQANNGIKEIYRVWYRTNSSTIPNKPSTHVTETSNNVNNTWTKVKPIEDSNYCYYFYCEETITNGGVSSWTNPVLDITTLSKYEVEALDSRTKTFFFPGDSSCPGAYVVGKNSDDGLDKTDISTYGFNTRVTTTGISIGYNAAKVLHLKTTPSPASLDFYKPPTISGNTVTEGELAASLSATGLILSKGGIKAGTAGQSGFIYLSTESYGSYSINSSSGISDWKEIIGTKFGVRADGTLYANNAVISGTITVGSGSTIDSGATIGGTSASTVVNNAATGAQASSDLSDFQTTVANTYATQSELSDVEGQIPSDINELSDTDGIIPNDLSQLTDTTNIISGAVSTGVAGKADKIEAVYRTQRIYYRKTSSGAPDENTTWLTSSGTGYGNWSLKIPQLTSGSTKYPYLYTAVQTQTISQYNSSATTNNCTCSTVLLDDSTTVIDGGTIITGSIAANRLDVYDASINKISASAIDVASIQIGQGQVNNLTTDLGNKANSSDSNWLVMITTTGIPDYVTPSVTLKATFYHGGTKATSGFGTPVWTKNGTTTLSGATFSNGESTITVTDIDAFYTCTISSN